MCVFLNANCLFSSVLSLRIIKLYSYDVLLQYAIENEKWKEVKADERLGNGLTLVKGTGYMLFI